MIQFIKAKDYYGKHATGWVFIVDGHPYCHGSLADCKESELYKRYKEQQNESNI